MEKRTFTAIALSIFIILIYQAVLAKFYPNAYKQTPAKSSAVETPAQPETIQARTIDSLFVPVTKEAAVEYTETEWGNFTIASEQGGVVSCALSQYVNSLNNEPDVIFNAEGLPATFSDVLLISNKIVVPQYKEAESVKAYEKVFTANAGGFAIIKRIAFREDYAIDITLDITNTSDSNLLADLYFVTASGIDKGQGIDSRYVVCKGKINNKIETFKIHKKVKPRIEKLGIVDWFALQNKYFSLAVKPTTKPKGFFLETYPDQTAVCGLTYSLNLQKGQSTSIRSFAYTGPNDSKYLENIGLEELVFSGNFAWAGQSVMNLLRFFHGIFRSWGLALIALGILVNLILYPITTKRYLESSQEMQKIQPKVNELRTKYKDDPKKMNEAMLALYKEHKINPLGGCLPLLLQMPIFIVLFRTLMKSIELKGAQFLWIKDLAEPDRLFALPFGGMFNHFNLLPVLMGLAMFLQQKITQQGAGKQVDKQQQQMIVMMPVIFCFMFYNFASGLVLYWLSSTLTMTTFSYINNIKKAS